MNFTDEEVKHIELSLKARIYLAQHLPPLPELREEVEKSWRILEKINGKTRAEISGREK